MSKKVSVIGLGYMGLPTAIILAEHGFEVFGYDIDEAKINNIKNCKSVINEPELIDRLKAVLSNNLKVSNKLIEADFYMISVPTPITESKSADLSAVWAVTKEISKIIKSGDTVILESTSSVGTTKKLAQMLEDFSGLKSGQDFFVGYSPERAIPGKTFFEVVNNNRVIGGINEKSTEKIHELYSQFVKGEISLTDSNTAEMVKLVENSSRDVQIAFANQVASMAYEAGIDPYELIDLANKHPRVKILSPRCGVGGHCIAVDPWFLIEAFPKQTELLQAARKVNDTKPYQVIEIVEEHIKKLCLSRKCNLLILGLTFKPDVDDLRESPALKIAQEFAKKENINLSVYDPNISFGHPECLSEINVLRDYKNAINSADLILILVGHKEFKNSADLFLGKRVLDFSGLNLNQVEKQINLLRNYSNPSTSSGRAG